MPRQDRAKAQTGVLHPFDLTSQQRQEELEMLADILFCIYKDLTPEQRAIVLGEAERAAA